MVFILTQALKPPQMPLNPNQKVIQPHTKTSPAQPTPGMGLAWAGPCLSLPAPWLNYKVMGAGRTLAFTIHLKQWGLNLIILLGKIIENIKTFI